MASHREIAERAAKEWEKHAHSTTFLDTKLHPKAMGWLIDAIESEVPPVSWTPEHLCSRSRRWPDSTHPSRLSFGVR